MIGKLGEDEKPEPASSDKCGLLSCGRRIGTYTVNGMTNAFKVQMWRVLCIYARYEEVELRFGMSLMWPKKNRTHWKVQQREGDDPEDDNADQGLNRDSSRSRNGIFDIREVMAEDASQN